MNTGEPTQESIKAAYPQWETRQGVDRLYYGRRTGPGAALTAGPAEDWMDLLDQIRYKEASLEDTPEAWRGNGPL